MSCELIFDFQQRFSIWRDGDATCPIWIFRDSLSPGSTRIVKSFDYPLDALKNSRLALRLFVPPCIDLAPLPVRNTPKSVTDSHFWQFPVICERLAFEQHAKLEAKCSLDNVLPINTYLGLPWASYIDKKKVPPLVRQIFGVRLHGYRTLANEWGLRWGQDLSVHTVCQHVQWKCMLSVWRELGVTDVHLTHCEPRSAVFAKQYGIRVYSWPLVAANVVNEGRREGLIFGKQLIEKQFLASFIGTHMPHYRSDIRLHLRKEALQDNGTDILLELTDDWHFETTVYQEQVNGQAMNISQLATEH